MFSIVSSTLFIYVGDYWNLKLILYEWVSVIKVRIYVLTGHQKKIPHT